MADFRIAAAQVASVRGDIEGNLATHVAAITAAAAHGVSVLVFPELSLTGYEPDLAAALAMTPADPRLAPLQLLARRNQIDVVVGAPLSSSDARLGLGAIVFTRSGAVMTYRKMHLGASEQTHFTPGDDPLAFTIQGQTIGLAICADSAQPSHPRAYAEAGATIYATGVFLNSEWYASDTPRLAGYAASHRMLVLMANHAASVGTYCSVGRSAVWSPGGSLLAQVECVNSCLVIATSSHGAWRAEVVEV
jgi:predicted amidohydrolase